MTEILSAVDVASDLAPAPTLPGEADALIARFQPIFDRIAAGALAREQRHALAYEAVGWLRDAGFTALRVPVGLGGGGVSRAALSGLLAALRAADSSLPQILRAHFDVVEHLLALPDRHHAERWLTLIAEGAIFGAVMAGRGGVTAQLTPDPRAGGWRMDGRQCDVAGSLYADWIVAVGADGEDRVLIALDTDAPGVTHIDHRTGFGERRAGSLTTRFDNVAVPANRVISRGHLAKLPVFDYDAGADQGFRAPPHRTDGWRSLLTQAAE